MKVAVWGAGNIGTGLVRRLAVSPSVSEIAWLNRSTDEIEKPAVDIGHGLAFAPCCRQIRVVSQDRGAVSLADVALLVLTLGARVPPGGARLDTYEKNAAILRETVIPVLQKTFEGIVIVVTNPVDLLARLLYKETGFGDHRIMGLGTVVETARLRASLGSHLSPPRPARDVLAFAVGTHDEHFVPVLMPYPAIGATLEAKERKRVVRLAKNEVVMGAERVKTLTGSSLHPIVEGVMAVAEAICTDSHAVLTVSCLDPSSKGHDDLFYSMPCAIGRTGIAERFAIEDTDVQENLRDPINALRNQISHLPA